jgi:hypothetical protein
MSARTFGVPGPQCRPGLCLAICLVLTLQLALAGPIRAQGGSRVPTLVWRSTPMPSVLGPPRGAFGPVVESPIAGDPVAIDSGQIAGKLLPFSVSPLRQHRCSN